jgi:hypothetical protein
MILGNAFQTDLGYNRQFGSIHPLLRKCQEHLCQLLIPRIALIEACYAH